MTQFFEQNFTEVRYLQFLRTEIIQVLANMFLNANNPNLPDDSSKMVYRRIIHVMVACV